MRLYDLENLDRACGGPVVHPAVRRRGYGRALLQHEALRAAANGRSVLTGQVVTGLAGEAFAAAAGATPGLVDVRRVQHLAKIEAGKVAELRRSAARAAAGYSLVNWAGDVPEQYLGPLAHVINAFEDAPRARTSSPRRGTPTGSGSAPAPTSGPGCCATTASRRCTTPPARWPPTPG